MDPIIIIIEASVTSYADSIFYLCQRDDIFRTSESIESNLFKILGNIVSCKYSLFVFILVEGIEYSFTFCTHI